MCFEPPVGISTRIFKDFKGFFGILVNPSGSFLTWISSLRFLKDCGWIRSLWIFKMMIEGSLKDP